MLPHQISRAHSWTLGFVDLESAVVYAYQLGAVPEPQMHLLFFGAQQCLSSDREDEPSLSRPIEVSGESGRAWRAGYNQMVQN